MTDAALLQQVQELIADVLDQPDLEITAETTAQDVPGWDSLNHINIVLAVEQQFGIKIHTAEIEELRNVGELLEIIEKKRKHRKA